MFCGVKSVCVRLFDVPFVFRVEYDLSNLWINLRAFVGIFHCNFFFIGIIDAPQMERFRSELPIYIFD